MDHVWHFGSIHAVVAPCLIACCQQSVSGCVCCHLLQSITSVASIVKGVRCSVLLHDHVHGKINLCQVRMQSYTSVHMVVSSCAKFESMPLAQTANMSTVPRVPNAHAAWACDGTLYTYIAANKLSEYV